MKGGEHVQIGGLGFINTMISSSNQANSQSSANGSFAGLFGSIMSGSASVQDSTVEMSVPQFTQEELTKLLQLLETDDILDVDGGLGLLEQSLFTNDSELLALIEQFIENQLDPQLEPLQVGQQQLSKSLSPEEMSEKIAEWLALLAELLALPANELTKATNHDLASILKTMKLFELLGNQQEQSQGQLQLKELLNQLKMKLELMAGNEKQLGRESYLQRTFTQVANEVNANTAALKGQVDGQTEQKPVQSKLESINGFVQFQQMSKPEQLTLTLNQAGRQTSSAELIKQFENILARSQFSNGIGGQKLMIKLSPEHLGSLRIELIQRDAGLIARILTSTATAKETLEAQLHGLKQAFGSQNIQVEKIEISQQLSSQQERFLNKEQQSDQKGHEQQEYRKADEEEIEDQTFNYSFEEALLNMEV